MAAGPAAADIRVFDDKQQLVDAAAAAFVRVVVAAQRARGTASVVLTGGSNGIAMLAALATHSGEIDWSAIDIWWGDDRFVPADDDERNEKQARDALLNAVPVDPDRIHPMAPSDGPLGDDIDAAAAAYAGELGGVGDDPTPAFDVHLLGMGGEGHINSLFPGSAAVAATTERVLAVRDSPKPPALRITLTLPAVNRARAVWFLVSGDDKAEAVAAAQAGADPAQWPCSGAHGTEETVWFLDRAAASRL